MNVLGKTVGRLFLFGHIATILSFAMVSRGFCEPAMPPSEMPAQPEEHCSPLCTAANDGDVAKVRQLLDAKTPVDDPGVPLSYAAGRGHLDVLKMLMKAGARIDMKDTFGQTALWCAARYDHFDCLTELVAAGANPNIPTDRGQTPLIVAARDKTTLCLTALLDKHPDLNAIDSFGCSALMAAAQNGFLDNVRALLKAGADIDLENTDEETALIKAGQRGQLEVVRYLTSAGAKKTKVFLNECQQRDANLTPAQRWALATTAVVAQRDGFSHESLGFGSKKTWIKIIQRDFRIKNREDLLKMLDQLATASSESKELDAVHLCKFIWTVRAGYSAGFLNADESWQKIMPIAQRIQRDFNSWEELGKGQMVVDGLRLKNDPARVESHQFIYNFLISKDEPNSPWNINPWNTPLGEPSK